MHTGTLRKLALALTFWLALRFSPLQASDLSVSGNLTVLGTSDLQGNTLTFGVRIDNSNPGAQLLYTDGTTSTLEFDASRSANIWKWQQNGGTTLKLQMSLNLSNDNELVLYNQASTPVAQITLNPLGTSTFQNSLTLNGTDNEMPNQTLVNSNSVLTEGLGDSRYASSSNFALGSASSYGITGSTLGLNGGTATGAFSFAEGNGSTASSYNSTAMGWHSTASGGISTAMGSHSNASGGDSTAMGLGSIASGGISTAMGYASNASGNVSTAMGCTSTASGNYSTAMGGNSVASGSYSTAMGNYSTASGYSSTALGFYSTASGKYSTAMGNQTIAQAYGSVAIGQFNIGGGTSNGWMPNDPLFEIGNGTPGVAGYTASGYYTWNLPPGTSASSFYYSSSSGYYIPGQYIPPVPPGYSDAFVVYKNGNTAVQGNLSAGGTISAASLSTTGTISAASVSTTSTVTAPTFVTTAPAGDIPMYTGN